MKITRYFQSCLLVEDGKVRILLDASGRELENLGKFGRVDAVLFTHEHSDHFDFKLAQKMMADNVPVYANASTAERIDGQPNIVQDGMEFSVGSVKIRAHELPHCLMVDGQLGPQNTGYLIAGRLFHAGDGVKLSGLMAEIIAGPITGPDISIKDAAELGRAVKAKIFIPIHYDLIGTKPEMFDYFSRAVNQPFVVRSIDYGQTIEI